MSTVYRSSLDEWAPGGHGCSVPLSPTSPHSSMWVLGCTFLVMPAPDVISQSATYFGVICWHSQLLLVPVTLLSPLPCGYKHLLLCCPVSKWQDVWGRWTPAQSVFRKRHKHCQSWSKLSSLSLCIVLVLLNVTCLTHVLSSIEWTGNTW